MSTTQGIDGRAYLSGWLKGLVGMYVADINAIPDDKWTASFGGCTRPANELTADALSLLQFCTAAMNGQMAGEYGSGMAAMAAECADKQTAIARFKEVTNEFSAALANASDELLNSEVMPPWQMPTPLFGLCQMAVSHIWYHDGQLNYIQCLLGDEKVHWMGD